MARYALSRRDTVTATMPSGDTQVQVLGRTAFVTLSWVASDTGAKVTATIDSVVADSGLTGLFTMLDSARNARWEGFRGPGGHLTELAGGPKSLIGDQVRDQVRLLFPALPPDGAHPGAVWHDSTTATARVSAFDATETTQSDYRAESLLTPTGALPITALRMRTVTGEGTQFGQAMTVRATGRDSLEYQVTPDGRVLLVQGLRLTDLVVDVPDVGQSVPAHERTAFRMTLVR
jgi:hypothetical protein